MLVLFAVMPLLVGRTRPDDPLRDPSMPGLLDAELPAWDVRERHATTVNAPAALVYQVAREFDMESVLLARLIFWLREKFMRATPVHRKSQGFIDEVLSLGWSCLREEPGRCFVAGAACQPWLADVVFSPIPRDRFRAYADPDQIKIAWTLEASARGDTLTDLATETRAAATDEPARRKFRRYWRWARVGIVPIRWLMLGAIRRQAEARWRHSRAGERS
jgi:hypothetical protein